MSVSSESSLSDLPSDFDDDYDFYEDSDDGADIRPPGSPSPSPPPSISSKVPSTAPSTGSRPRISLGNKMQAVTFYAMDLLPHQILALMGVGTSSTNRLYHQAKSSGFDPAISKICQPHHVEEAPRTGRPKTS
jgi:hypothetical protein